MNIIIFKPRSKGLGMFEMMVCLSFFSDCFMYTHVYKIFCFFGYTYIKRWALSLNNDNTLHFRKVRLLKSETFHLETNVYQEINKGNPNLLHHKCLLPSMFLSSTIRKAQPIDVLKMTGEWGCHQKWMDRCVTHRMLGKCLAAPGQRLDGDDIVVYYTWGLVGLVILRWF